MGEPATSSGEPTVSGRRSFLVIGAQKCGTTTLFADLREHPSVWLAEKESAHLLHVATADDPRREYDSRLSADPGLVSGEVATEYSMLPRVDAVSIARRVFETVKVVYIVRDPILRAISHHHHLLALGAAPGRFDDAVRQLPELVDFSRYAMQLAPWLDGFGRANVHVICFEDYMADRRTGSTSLYEFLGLHGHDLARPDVAHNAASTRRVATGRWRALRNSHVYQRGVRRALPEKVRSSLTRALLPASPPRPPGPDPSTLAWLRNELAPEVQALAEVIGRAPWPGYGIDQPVRGRTIGEVE